MKKSELIRIIKNLINKYDLYMCHISKDIDEIKIFTKFGLDTKKISIFDKYDVDRKNPICRLYIDKTMPKFGVIYFCNDIYENLMKDVDAVYSNDYLKNMMTIYTREKQIRMKKFATENKEKGMYEKC